jgi:DNA-binding transcriptional regulator YdaS (Cro superfamily)
MKLSEFLSLTRLTSTEVAREIGINPQTLWSALQGYEMSLSNALKIEDYTKKAVTCNDLRPTKKRKSSKDVINAKGDNGGQTHNEGSP